MRLFQKAGLAVICYVGLIFPSLALAHDAPRVETIVSLNDAGELGITHTLQLSATQRLLFKAGVIDKNDMTGLHSRAQAAIYSSERFDLKADGKSVPLEILGAEVSGGHLYVYQIGTLQTLPAKWTARNAILRDLSPRFDNVVNVPTGAGVKTIVFSGSNIDGFIAPD